MTITKHFTFEASHVLPKHEGKCSRLHGHSWGLTVTVSGDINPATGFVVDYARLSEVVKTHIINRLDHTHLGYGIASHSYGVDLPVGETAYPPFGVEFYPSSENLCRAIFKLLNPLIQELAKDVRLNSITIAETCTSEATWSAVDEHISTQHLTRK